VDRLTEAQRGVVLVILRAPQAWFRWDELAPSHGAGVIDELMAAGVLEVWNRPDSPGGTLAPWGAFLDGQSGGHPREGPPCQGRAR
jgi:hypothetical protein